MPVPTPADVDALRRLAATYARAVDRRDAALLATVFDEDAVLELYDPSTSDAPTGVRRGHAELAAIVDLIARFDATFHFVGQALFDADADADGDGATGEVYCLAHHLAGGDDMVMFIRYDDRYRRADDGRWVITLRRVLVDWRETHQGAFLSP